MSPARPGKTLPELLVVMAIVAVLLAVLLTAVQRVRARAARLRDENSQRQVGLAAHGYQAQNGRLPPLVGRVKPPHYAEYPIPAAAHLLAHLEQPSAAQLLDPRRAPASTPYHFHVVPAYVSALDPSHTAGRVVFSDDVSPGVGNVAFNVQVFGPKYPAGGDGDGKASLAGTFPDGTSNTLLLAGKRGRCGPPVGPGGWVFGGSWWMSVAVRGRDVFDHPAALTHAAFVGHKLPATDGTGATFQVVPAEADCDPDLAQGLHPGGLTATMADGSVRTVRAGVAAKLWRAGLLPADGSGLPPD